MYWIKNKIFPRSVGGHTRRTKTLYWTEAAEENETTGNAVQSSWRRGVPSSNDGGHRFDVEVGVLLEGVGHSQQHSFIEMFPHEL